MEPAQSESWRDVQTLDDRIEMLDLQIRRRDHALDVQEGKLRELEAERDRLHAAVAGVCIWLDSPQTMNNRLAGIARAIEGVRH